VTPAHSVPYTIQPEDSLTSIAQRHGTTVPAILSCNHIPNPNVIYAGTVIQIPSTARTVTGGSKGQWIVDPGNTMGYIANYYGVSVQSIVDANHSKYPQLTADYVQAGWVLNIP
jgi:LysM repeat protein